MIYSLIVLGEDLMTSESNIDVVSDTMAVNHQEKQLDEPMIDASGVNPRFIFEEKNL